MGRAGLRALAWADCDLAIVQGGYNLNCLPTPAVAQYLHSVGKHWLKFCICEGWVEFKALAWPFCGSAAVWVWWGWGACLAILCLDCCAPGQDSGCSPILALFGVPPGLFLIHLCYSEHTETCQCFKGRNLI